MKLQEIDEELMELAKRIKPEYYLEPLNKNEEKEAFLSGKRNQPKFVYRDVEYDVRKVENSLNALLYRLPNHKLTNAYKELIHDCL